MAVELIEFNPTLTVEVRADSGCYYHRIGEPLRHTEIIPKTQTLYFSRMSGFLPEQIKEMLKLGIKVVMDIDDSLTLNRSHILYDSYKRNGTTQKMIELAKLASVVLVTNEHLAKEISQYNKNVQIVPNSINYGVGQFVQDTSEKTFDAVYAGSITHQHDIDILTGCLDGVNLKLAGVSDHPVWNDIVKKIPKVSTFDYLPLDSYMDGWKGAKVGLAPLVKNSFNICKSNLKVLEAASVGIPIITSKTAPYYNDLDKDTVIYANSKESWIIQIRKLLNDKVYYEEKRQQLIEHCHEHYHMDKVNLIRKDILENL